MQVKTIIKNLMLITYLVLFSIVIYCLLLFSNVLHYTLFGSL